MIDKSGCLKWEEQDRIGIIKISAPPRNLLPSPKFADIEIVRQWVEQPHIRGIILTGEGRHFSAGADLSYFDNSDDKDYASNFFAGREILDYWERIEKPFIASIDGACLGGGLELALACHMRYCSQNAVFGFPEITHGIIPGLGGTERLVKAIGRSRALEVLLGGDTFGAERALNLGIINGIVDSVSAFAHAKNIMLRIIKSEEKPVAYCIKSVNISSNNSFVHSALEENRMLGELVISQYGG